MVLSSRLSQQSEIGWNIRVDSNERQGLKGEKHLYTSSFDSNAWTHVVVTVSAHENGATMKIYKDKEFVGCKEDGQVPKVMKRSHHHLGADLRGRMNLNGKIAYLKVWQDYELTKDDVEALYDLRKVVSSAGVSLINNGKVRSASKEVEQPTSPTL